MATGQFAKQKMWNKNDEWWKDIKNVVLKMNWIQSYNKYFWITLYKKIHLIRESLGNHQVISEMGGIWT